MIREEYAVSPSSTLTKNTLEERILKSIKNKNLTLDEITDVLEKSFTKEETFASANKGYMAIRNAIEDLKQKEELKTQALRPMTKEEKRNLLERLKKKKQSVKSL